MQPTATLDMPAPSAVTHAAIRHRISTKERRYHFEDVRPLLAFCHAHGTPLEYVPGRQASDITTVYLDTIEGTWSAGFSPDKLRCKNYGDPNHYWFELKRREGLKVNKKRQSITPHELPEVTSGVRRGRALLRRVGTTPIVPLVAVRYRRIAFEWEGVRVTIDRSLRFHAVGSGTPWTIGRCIGSKQGFVVEVKCEGALPEWLAPAFSGRRPQQFSKSKWALAARRMPWAR
ncbi:MAG: VTC domain-containing protein [Planctomycetota bacterium]|jgi:hypothetical protein